MENKSCYKKCTICGIQMKPKSKILFSSFPLDPERCQLWVKATGNKNLVSIPIEKLHEKNYLCGSHFAPECFNKNGTSLLQTAVPTERLAEPLLSDNYFDEFPLHVKSFHDMELERPVVRVESSNINGCLVVEKSNPNFKDELMITSANESCTGSDELVPIPSTSKASLHVTLKRKREDITTHKDDGIQVKSYKTTRMGNNKTSASEVLTEREKVILTRLQDPKVTLKKIEKSPLDLDKLDFDVLKLIVQNAVNNHKKDTNRKHWSLKNKITALAIFKRSPKAYSYMQTLLPLPSTGTLQQILKGIPMEPGLHLQIMKILKKKAQEMEDKDKHCVLLFGEMALKKRLYFNETMDKVEGFVDLGDGVSMGRRNKVAGHALVFMIQGIKQRFKQPIAHYFVEGTLYSEKLAVLVKDIIKAIHDSGFNVISTVCKHGLTNIAAVNLLKEHDGLMPDSNYFFVNKKKVFIMFDVPHLFKSIRNNFLQAGEMEYKGKIARWRHLKEVEEKNRNLLHFKTITKTVVNPSYKAKMHVKFAAQALSNTMAAVLKMIALSETKDGAESNAEEINNTAFVVEEMDKLFDCTNGPATPEDIKKGFRENVSKKTKHKESWTYYLKYIETVKFFKLDTKKNMKNVRCIKSYVTSLKSLKDIWHLLNKEAKFKDLNLRQLNQDSLENLFDIIRQHGATNRNPTCAYFNVALKSSILSGLSSPHSSSSNFEVDSNSLLIPYKELTQKVKPVLQNVNSGTDANVCCPVLLLPDSDIEYFETLLCSSEEQPVINISGYLAARVMSKFSCDSCKRFLIEDNPNFDDTLYSNTSLKEWWQDRTLLTYPKKELCHLVNEAKNVYDKIVAPSLHNQHISQYCISQLSTHLNMKWLECGAHFKDVSEYIFTLLRKLFIRRSCAIYNSELIIAETVAPDKKK